MKIIIFDNSVDGHHLEYIHHIYEMCLKYLDHQFVFVLPSSFNSVKEKLIWESSPNVSFELYPESLIEFGGESLFYKMKKSADISKLVDFYIKKHNANHVFMIGIMTLLPTCIFKIKSNVKISGIIYQIYLYRDDKSSLIKKTFDRLKYIILTRSKLFKYIFILNDVNSTNKLNLLYKTSRFRYLVDPYVPVKPENINIRKEYNIPSNHKLLIHIGALNDRKGTLSILDSILDLPSQDKKKLAFFFAGKVDKGIRKEFYNMLEKITDVNIIVKDEFCSYGFFASLCAEADAILIPYKIDNLSSGIIGYASQFRCPVIAPSSGLIGTLVKMYKLGYLLSSISNKELIKAYHNVLENTIPSPDIKYCKTHTIKEFNEIISTILD